MLTVWCNTTRIQWFIQVFKSRRKLICTCFAQLSQDIHRVLVRYISLCKLKRERLLQLQVFWQNMFEFLSNSKNIKSMTHVSVVLKHNVDCQKKHRNCFLFSLHKQTHWKSFLQNIHQLHSLYYIYNFRVFIWSKCHCFLPVSNLLQAFV